MAEDSAGPRPVGLMNTIRADRHGVHDTLTTPAELRRWLTDAGLSPGDPAVSAADLRAAIDLRNALRRLAALRTRDTRPAARSAMGDVQAAVAVVNELAAAGRCRDALDVSGEQIRLRPAGPPPDPAAALAVVAAEGIRLFTAPDLVLNACHAPGCVLYFVKDHPRREWCSTGCGNRVRAARHYARRRVS